MTSLLLLLLLMASPAQAVSIVLTSGTIDIDHTGSLGVVLIGPDLHFTGQLWQDFGGVFVTSGGNNRVQLNAALVGTLTYQGQTYPNIFACEQSAGPVCGFLRTPFYNVDIPLGATSGTTPFSLEGAFGQGNEPGSLAERLTFSGSGLLTASAPLTLHYEISTPEPATWLLLLTGLLVLGWRHRH